MTDSDVCSDVEEISPIIDCDVLEAAKENIQPLAKGRRVTALSAILATPHAQRENRLAATRQRLRMNVDIALEDSVLSDDEVEEDNYADPLEAYCTYVNWVVENYPQGHSAESGLLEVLEEATRVLKDHQNGRWRTDIRYLKLWVLYASYVEKPTIVYKFCLVNEIGSQHALLYEEAALALERAGRKPEADETYSLGIARKAQPLDRLEAKYREFQKRMMSSPSIPASASSAVADVDVSATSTPPAATNSRRALGESGGATGSSRTTRSSSRLASASSSLLPMPVPARPQPNARIPVFVDKQGASSSNDQGDAPSAWTDLGTRKSRIKENVKEATKAAGTTLRQTGRSTRAVTGGRTPKISVFRDSEPNEDEENRAAVEVSSDSPPPPATLAIPKKGGKSKLIPIFRDDEPGQTQSKSSKSGKGISVFRDEESDLPQRIYHEQGVADDDEPGPSQKMKNSKSRNETNASLAPAAVTAHAKKSKSSKGIAVFREEASDRHSKTQDSQVDKGIAVFRDEDSPEPPAKLKSKARKGITILRDDGEPEASRKARDTKPMKGIAIFRDEDPETPITQEVAAKPKQPSKSKGKSTIAVFCDDEADGQPETKKLKVASGKTNPKDSITIFRDEATASEDSVDAEQRSPNAAMFTPFKDEDDEPEAPSQVSSGKTLGILGQGAGSSAVKMSSEAEALRRDPLKNYPADERTDDVA